MLKAGRGISRGTRRRRRGSRREDKDCDYLLLETRAAFVFLFVSFFFWLFLFFSLRFGSLPPLTLAARSGPGLGALSMVATATKLVRIGELATLPALMTSALFPPVSAPQKQQSLAHSHPFSFNTTLLSLFGFPIGGFSSIPIAAHLMEGMGECYDGGVRINDGRR